MIIVRNRELLIPREEFNIGTSYDDNTETREFRLEAVTAGGVDIRNLLFKLDIKYANGKTDTALLDKVLPESVTEPAEPPKDECTDSTKILVIPPFPVPKPPIKPINEYITLILTVTKNMLQVPGSVLIQIRGYSDDGLLKWTSYQGALFVEEAINTPGTYSGNLTELEQLEKNIDNVIQSEAARQAAETKREEDFKAAINDFNNDRQELKDYSVTSKSYAVGGTASREGEDTDNAKYYSEHASTSEANAKEYMETTARFMNAIAPNFHTDFTDGNLYYNKESTYVFNIDSGSGNLEYDLIGG